MNNFDKSVSLQVKGLAVLLMVAHHVFMVEQSGIDECLDYGNYAEAWHAFGKMCKLCVSLFMFVGGYGLYFSNKKDGNSLKRMIKLLRKYWCVCVVIVPILLFFRKVSLLEVVLNTFCISSSINGTWWFMQTYLLYMLLLPLFSNMVELNKYVQCLLILTFAIMNVLAPIVRDMGFPLSVEIHYFMYYLLIFYMGMIVCRYDLLNRLYIKCGKNRSILAGGLLLFLTIVIRAFFGTSLFNYITSFAVCLLMINIKSVFLLFVGKHSMNIWLIHMFFIEGKYLGTYIGDYINTPIFAFSVVVLFSILFSIMINCLGDFMNAYVEEQKHFL